MDDKSNNIYINATGLAMVCIGLLFFKCRLRYIISILLLDDIIILVLLILLSFFIYKIGKFLVK